MDKARRALSDELDRLGATDCILSTNIKTKIDGNPYSQQPQPTDRGVAVWFKFKGKQTVIACDKWNRVEDNVWSIYKTIDALRGIRRWGSSRMMEQAFRGYAALPEHASRPSWWSVLKVSVNASPEQVKEAYLKSRKNAHPDSGGNHDDFVAIQNAYDEFKKSIE